jgi:outer membrane protein
LGRLAVAIFAVSLAAGAHAQPLEEADDPQKAEWRFTVGGGVGWTPKYPGADSYRLRALPVIGVSYGRFFAGGDSGGGVGGGLGVNLLSHGNWRLGVALALGFGDARRESDHPSLQGTGDIERTTRGVIFGGYTWRWLSAQLRIAPDVAGNDQGTLAFFDVSVRYRASEQLFFSAGPGITWADDDYMMTFFGVSAEQAARSTLPAYEARGGVHAVRFGVNAGYRIDRAWSVGGRLGTARLRGDAAASPITRDRTQNLAAVFVSYRF